MIIVIAQILQMWKKDIIEYYYILSCSKTYCSCDEL